MAKKQYEVEKINFQDFQVGKEHGVRKDVIKAYGIEIPFIIDQESQTLTLDMNAITDQDLDRIGIAFLQDNPDGLPDSDYETYSLEDLQKMLQEGKLVFSLPEIFQSLGMSPAGIIYIVSKMNKVHTTFFVKNNE